MNLGSYGVNGGGTDDTGREEGKNVQSQRVSLDKPKPHKKASLSWLIKTPINHKPAQISLAKHLIWAYELI